MRHTFSQLTMLMLCRPLTVQELKVTGSRESRTDLGRRIGVYHSGGESSNRIGNPRLARAETRRIHRGYDIGRNLCAEIPSEERAARLQR